MNYKKGGDIMRTNLKLFRVKKMLSQDDVAARVGCTRATYSSIESGKRDGRLTFWNDFQKAFNVSDSEMWALLRDE
jgi:DNA-binding XRE family transcriptional regulator